MLSILLSLTQKKPALDFSEKELEEILSSENHITLPRNLYDSGIIKKMDLGSRIAVRFFQSEIYLKYPKFSDFIYDNEIGKHKKGRGFFLPDLVNFVKRNEDFLNSLIDVEYDFKFSLAALESLKATYLLRCKNKIIESPQYQLLREAVGIWYPREEERDFSDEDALREIKSHYFKGRELLFTNATPIKSNSGCKAAPLISCFIQKLVEDSIDGIGQTLKNTMDLQKGNGGVSTSIHEMRPAGDIIESSGRICDGVCKPLKIADEIAFYVDQNKKRAGAHVFWLAAYHPDIFEFIYMKDQFKDVEKHALRLFDGVWQIVYSLSKLRRTETGISYLRSVIRVLTWYMGKSLMIFTSHIFERLKIRDFLLSSNSWKKDP